MHFQKLCAVICGVTFLVASSLNLKADDTDAQAKAREALRKAMEELNAQQGKPASKPAAPAVKETPAPAPKPVPVTPAPEPVAPAPAPAAVAPTPAPEPAPTAVAPAPTAGFPQSKLSAEDQERVLEAMRNERAKLDAAEQAGAKSKAPPVAIKSGNGSAEQAELKKEAKEQEKKEREMQKMAAKSGTPITPPPADMAPGSKEQRLYELLQKYKADQITPTEYHQQRAKILAE